MFKKMVRNTGQLKIDNNFSYQKHKKVKSYNFKGRNKNKM